MEIEVKGTKFKIGDVLYEYDGWYVFKYEVVGFSINATNVFANNMEVGKVYYLLLKDDESKPIYKEIGLVDHNCFKTREELLEFHKATILDSEITKPRDPNEVYLELAKAKIQSPLRAEGY